MKYCGLNIVAGFFKVKIHYLHYHDTVKDEYYTGGAASNSENKLAKMSAKKLIYLELSISKPFSLWR